MGKFRAKQDITIKCDSKADANKVFEYLSENHDEREYWDQFGARVEGSMDVIGYYDPPVYCSKNGDGNPALIELEDGISEDWLEEEIEEKLGIKVKVSTELSNE